MARKIPDPKRGDTPPSEPTTVAIKRKVAARRAYDVTAVESKWRERWEETGIYRPDLLAAKRPYYNLMMFPYPSAEGLHVGNMYAYIGSDVQARWRAMRGYDVFEPMGFDAFGIHSENYAMSVKKHPRELTAQNIPRFREQLKRIGNRFDWSHEVQTTDPSYYRWTQWIFVQLFNAGLVQRKSGAVNWCPKDKTVLADEQVIDGRCERCDSIVERRDLEQWYFAITRYADALLDGLETLDWSERVKAAQRHWIGRSQGADISFTVVPIEDGGEKAQRIIVFTTRPDTLFGVTFIAVSPDSPLAATLADAAHRDAVEAYVDAVRTARVPTEREADRPMTGVFTGRYATHPLTGELIPIWIADYVLAAYGAGAVMGVPAHDARDYAIAQAVDLPIRTVVTPTDGADAAESGNLFTGRGILTNSADFSGMPSDEASRAIVARLAERGSGAPAVRYHLRDWLVSRQRYWGTPIPIVYCPEHGAVAVPDDQLPVLLPEVIDYRPTGTGVSPLATVASFVETSCPVCGGPARRETDVCDNFLDSSWYYLRYPSSDDNTQPWDPDITRKWLPVDMYVGGAEHSVLHLLYARFITRALHDLGHLDFAEPFTHFRANGMITYKGAKMSKSRQNVVNPDEYIGVYGADAFRTYMLFTGQYESGGDFSEEGLEGVLRFLDRMWRFVDRHAAVASTLAANPAKGESLRRMHATIQRVADDIGELKYNTAIAALMGYLNWLEASGNSPSAIRKGVPNISRAELHTLLKLLAPIAPFVTEELWSRLGEADSIHVQPWPEVDEAALRATTLNLVVQVDGRVRGHLNIAADLPQSEIEERAQALASVRRQLSSREVTRIVHVARSDTHLLNIVTMARQ